METKEMFENVFRNAVCKISAQLVEKQEEMIMKLVHEAGGTRYEHITLDKSKVVDALENATARDIIKNAVLSENQFYRIVGYECPKCGKKYDNVENYCPNCGQKFNRVKV